MISTSVNLFQIVNFLVLNSFGSIWIECIYTFVQSKLSSQSLTNTASTIECKWTLSFPEWCDNKAIVVPSLSLSQLLGTRTWGTMRLGIKLICILDTWQLPSSCHYLQTFVEHLMSNFPNSRIFYHEEWSLMQHWWFPDMKFFTGNHKWCFPALVVVSHWIAIE